jgi:hypothetical protein
MSNNAEFDALERALKQANTQESKQAAAEAMRRYVKSQEQSLHQRQGTKPMLVSLGSGKGYPNSVPLDQLPELMQTNPALYDQVKKVITEGK